MTTTDSVFQRALSNMLTEIFEGPPGQEAYVLNPGDPGLLRQLDAIDANAHPGGRCPEKRRSSIAVDLTDAPIAFCRALIRHAIHRLRRQRPRHGLQAASLGVDAERPFDSGGNQHEQRAR